MIGRTISHYKIVDKLGEGGMGAVYKAEDTTLNRLVAIKVLSSHLAENDEARERFVREAQAASSLNHSNITTVYELLEDDGEQYIVMEYVDGKTIRDVVESSRVSIRKAVDILIQAAEALEAAHNKGILHRDVKSANIMVSMEGNVKVMDFGLAHLEERSQLTRTGTTMGTLAYSSPEQLVGSPVDRRSEIFSLGVVFYELLTGQLPFKSPSEGELVFEIINTEQDMLTTCREDVPENVCSVVNKMLIKKPELRYQTCGELLNDLKTIRSELETTTVQISGTSSPSSRHWLRKKSSIIAVAIIVALVGITFAFLLPRSGPVRIAVLPFENQGNSETDWFANILSDQIRQGLRAYDQFAVGSRSSAMSFKDSTEPAIRIGESLHADYVVTAVVLLLPNTDGIGTVMLIPELIRVVNDQQIWSETFEGNFESASEFQDSIVEQVATWLDPTSSGVAPDVQMAALTTNPEALQHYMQGAEYLNRVPTPENIRIAIDRFEQSVEDDPSFALAWARLSDAHQDLHWRYYDRSEQRQTSAWESIERAVHLNPDAFEVQLVLGAYHYHLLDYDRALQEFEPLSQTHPNDAELQARLGYVYRRQGAMDNATASLERAVDLDSANPDFTYNLAETYLLLRRYRDAERYFKATLRLRPEDELAHAFLARTYLHWNGDVTRASETSERAWPFIGSNQGHRILLVRVLLDLVEGAHDVALRRLISYPSSIFETQFYFVPKHQLLAQIYTLSGDQERATAYFDSSRIQINERLIDRPLDPNLHSALGIALAGLGQFQEAITEGKMATNLLPTDREAYRGYFRLMDLAQIYTMTGQQDDAIDMLEQLLSNPSCVSVPLLRLDPIWNPLRDHPRFQALLAKYN